MARIFLWIGNLFSVLIFQITIDHHRDLEHDGVVKFPQVQTRQFLDFFQTVNQRIAVHVQLSGRFGNVQIVLKEFVNGIQCVRVQRFNGVLLEHLGQEHFAQGDGQLINDTADAQILIADKILPTSMATCASL